MEALFRAVREACTAAAWSRGVQLVRAGAVVGLRERDGEIELRVTAPGTTLAVPVYLTPDDEDLKRRFQEISKHADRVNWA